MASSIEYVKKRFKHKCQRCGHRTRYLRVVSVWVSPFVHSSNYCADTFGCNARRVAQKSADQKRQSLVIEEARKESSC